MKNAPSETLNVYDRADSHDFQAYSSPSTPNEASHLTQYYSHEYDVYFRHLDEWNACHDKEIFNILSDMSDGIAKGHPIVFVSYSHDSETHKLWVKNFANDLRRAGIEVLLDQYLAHGINFVKFMDFGLKFAYKIIVIGTPNYRLKCMDPSCGVRYENSIISTHILRTIHSRQILPSQRKGSFRDAFP